MPDDPREKIAALTERTIRMEVVLANTQEDVSEIKKILEELKTQSQWVRGGIILIVAVGGIITWLSNIWDFFKK